MNDQVLQAVKNSRNGHSEYNRNKCFKQQFLKLRIILEQMSIKGAELFILNNGKLVSKDFSCQTEENNRVVRYSHTVRGQPEQYHIEAIKQYKKQLDQMRRNYYELQRAYWQLLGYRVEGDQIPYTPYISMVKERNQLCVTQVSEENDTPRQLNRSSVDFNDMMTQIEETKKKGGQLSESIIQFNTNLPYGLKTPNEHTIKSAFNNGKIKTEGDEAFEEQLIEALKEVQDLRIALQQAHFEAQVQVREIKLNYEEHKKKLQQILERERKHTKMLNGVIHRLRSEIQSKDKLIKTVMGLKSTDKNAIQKLMKQFKVSVC